MQKTTPMTKITDRLSVPTHTHPLMVFNGVSKYKSVWRQMRRGNVGKSGAVMPGRPFNNRKRTEGRKLQVIYENNLKAIKSVLAKGRQMSTQEKIARMNEKQMLEELNKFKSLDTHNAKQQEYKHQDTRD